MSSEIKLRDYRLVKKINDKSWEAIKTVFNPDGESETYKFIIKKVVPNILIKKLLNISQNNLSKMFMATPVDYFEENNQDYIVTEFIEGKTLDNIKTDDSNVLIEYMSQMIEGLDYLARNGIAHNNIKPKNIILDSELGRLKFIDFSNSCVENESCRSADIYYTPPELIEKFNFDFNSAKSHDIWSLGAVFYEMVNHKSYIDFKSKDPEIIAKDIILLPVNRSESSYSPINKIIEFMLKKDPDMRIDATELTALINISRPNCEVDGIIYNRAEAESILLEKGYSSLIVEELDNQICEKLTREMEECRIRGVVYSLEGIKKICKLLNIELGKNPCKNLTRELEYDFKLYCARATTDLINILNISSKLTSDRLDENEKIYYRRLDVYKNLDLISIPILKQIQENVLSKYEAYKEKGLETFAKREKFINNHIVDILIDIENKEEKSYEALKL